MQLIICPSSGHVDGSQTGGKSRELAEGWHTDGEGLTIKLNVTSQQMSDILTFANVGSGYSIKQRSLAGDIRSWCDEDTMAELDHGKQVHVRLSWIKRRKPGSDPDDPDDVSDMVFGVSDLWFSK